MPNPWPRNLWDATSNRNDFSMSQAVTNASSIFLNTIRWGTNALDTSLENASKTEWS